MMSKAAMDGGAQSPSKVADVYRRCKQQIIMSELPGGHHIVELDLADAMNCSQSTVREALLRLQEDGLIVRQSYRGSTVSQISPQEAQIFLELRAWLEGKAATHYLPNITADHLLALKSLVVRMEHAADAGDEYALFELDQEFHVTLFQLANLPMLVPVLVRCSYYSHRNKIAQSVAPRTMHETARRHWRVIEALEGGDATELESVLRHHVSSIIGEDNVQQKAELRMSPDMIKVQLKLKEEDGHLPNVMDMPIAAARDQFNQVNKRWNDIELTNYHIEHFAIPSPFKRLDSINGIETVRIASKKNGGKAGTIFHLHGGGWVFGNNDTHLGAMTRLADLTACTVIGINYGLAPEAPFPAGLNDCTWAWRWLRAQPDGDVGPWYVAGDSAGAALALSMMIDLRHTGETLPDAALLFYGVYNADHTTQSHRLCGQGDFGLSSEKMAWYRAHYLSDGRYQVNDPRVSPLLADLKNLPPMLITAAGLDPLKDDSVELAKRLTEVGGNFEFKVYEGVLHGFMQLSSVLPEALRAFEDAATYLKSRNINKKEKVLTQ
jgi:acetyl esterase/lipase/DNA-binding GntR family transcriptional regulator